jgi:hypothetical protein
MNSQLSLYWSVVMVVFGVVFITTLFIIILIEKFLKRKGLTTELTLMCSSVVAGLLFYGYYLLFEGHDIWFIARPLALFAFAIFILNLIIFVYNQIFKS